MFRRTLEEFYAIPDLITNALHSSLDRSGLFLEQLLFRIVLCLRFKRRKEELSFLLTQSI